MPSQIRWDEHVMNPPPLSLFLSLSLCVCVCVSVWSVNAQLANCISLKTTPVWIRNQLGNEWECMFHMFSPSSPRAKDL